MDIFKEMADIAMKEFGGLGLIYLSICICFCVYLIVIHWLKLKQNGWSGFVGPTVSGLDIGGCNGFFGGVSELFSIFG
jgi:hypothetical protein